MQIRRRAAAAALAGAAAVLVACGAAADFDNDPRPPSPIVLTGEISDRRVSVSPRAFGAGPISLVVTNQTAIAQRVILESAGRIGAGPGLRQETAPISPRDTATLDADVAPGRYTVHVAADGIAAARLRVGGMRPSAQNELLQP
ncbi:MAG: hypothetical protein QOG35_1519 [Solirubrobacteraceae bacterium]|jgi:hypothetical protein|nr:hypothetical protein [Solirubrobacteraceae bacterium]